LRSGSSRFYYALPPRTHSLRSFLPSARAAGRPPPRVSLDGAKIRLELPDSKDADNPQAVYAISVDGGRTVLTEPGETLDGHPTRHHKLRISSSMHFLKTDARLS